MIFLHNNNHNVIIIQRDVFFTHIYYLFQRIDDILTEAGDFYRHLHGQSNSTKDSNSGHSDLRALSA